MERPLAGGGLSSPANPLVDADAGALAGEGATVFEESLQVISSSDTSPNNLGLKSQGSRESIPAPQAASPEFMEPFPQAGHDPTDFNEVMSRVSQEVKDASVAREAEEESEEEVFANQDSKTQRLHQQFKDATESGKIEVASGLGQRFRRELKGDSKLLGDYSKMRTDAQRAAFRMDWAKQKLTELTVSKSEAKTWRKVDISKGSYYTLERIAQEYGYTVCPARAIQSARAYCLKCLELKGKWLRFDGMSQQYMFLFLVQEAQETFEECWRMYSEQKSTSSSEKTGGTEATLSNKSALGVATDETVNDCSSGMCHI